MNIIELYNFKNCEISTRNRRGKSAGVDNDEFGRCVTANINIDVGQIVLIEEAFLLSASSTNLKSVHEFYRLCPVLKCHVL